MRDSYRGINIQEEAFSVRTLTKSLSLLVQVNNAICVTKRLQLLRKDNCLDTTLKSLF